MRTSDRVRFHHEKRNNGVRVQYQKERKGESSP